jgi:hypothetical protein
LTARVQGAAVVQGVLVLAYRRLAERVADLEARLDVEPATWSEFYVAVQTLTSIVPRLGEGEMLTTGDMAKRLGLSTKTLLRHKKAGAIKPAVQRGKLIRWKGDEALSGNGNGNGARK